MKNYFLLSVLILLFSSMFRTNPSNDGTWVLSYYFDSMLVNKSVAKISLNNMSFHNVIVKLNSKDVQIGGLVNWKINFQRDLNTDTFTFNSNFGKFAYFFKNKNLCCIMNNNQNIVYQYRRVENSKLEAIIEKYDRSKFIDYMQKRIVTNLFSGNYELQSDTLHVIKFNPDNTTSGLNNFTTFRIHDYIGTFNPYDSLDAIIFCDSKKKNFIYNWRFRADTLILQQLVTEDNEHFKLSNNILVLRKMN